MSRLLNYRLLLILAAAVFVLDQATKHWIVSNLLFGAFYPPDAIEVIPGWFNLVHVGNTGAAWSLFEEHTELLSLVGFIALGMIFWLRKTLELKRFWNQLAFGLIIGGILGNLLDRIRLGHVTDFLDFHFRDHHFPSFNVADSGITVGVTIYLIASLFQKPQSEALPNGAAQDSKQTPPTD